MNEFELQYRLAGDFFTRTVAAHDAEAAELLAPLEATEISVRALRRKGPACRRMLPAHWPPRR
jgi:hypothetical protein